MLLSLSEHAQSEVLQHCNAFKKRVMQQASSKKTTMKRCYAYFKSQFYGDDLLPSPTSGKQDNDAASNRPELFIPLTREQLKLLYAYLKLTLFPNNEDYFRVKGKNELAARYEYELTEALKYLFKQSQITEKLGQFIMDTLWAGFAVANPTFETSNRWEWSTEWDEYNQPILTPLLKNDPPKLSLELWNPLAFYIDTSNKGPEHTAWGYFTSRHKDELMSLPWLMNKPGIDACERLNANEHNLDEYNQLTHTTDNKQSLACDYYYFPIMMIEDRTYQNILVTVVNGQILAEFRPNMMPTGLNPVVYCTWMDDRESPYGTGPAEDIKDIQRLVNILYNYQIETFARIGNRFVVKDTVDLTNFFGVAGGVATAQDPQQDIVPITGDYIETTHIANLIGTLKAEAHMLAGTQQPFQGAANIDFKKTATEIQLLQENSISVVREAVEHLSNQGIQPLLERLMLLASQLYQQPLAFRLDNQMNHFLTVDLSMLASGDFTIELTNINPAESRQAQASNLLRMMQILADKPELLAVAEPILIQIGLLWGLKDIRQILDDIKQRLAVHTPIQNIKEEHP
jgi:hypothetical protein